jgi:hypothetical protein
MAERRDRPSFLFETPQAFCIGREGCRQNF